MKTRNLFYHVVTAAILLAMLLLQGAGIPARSARADGTITFTGHVITETTDAFSVYAADVDGDGDLDVLSASDDDDEIAWYENDGGSPPTFTTHVITTSAVRAHSVYAADLDNDSDMDVMSAAYAGDEIAWYENDGSSPPVFTCHVIASNTDGAQVVYAADVDGDGDMDVLSASNRDDKTSWYENDGGSPPAFTTHIIATSCDGAISVYAVDADGDSDMDILSGCYDGDRIIWYENDGSSFPAFTGHVITTTVDAIESVYAADLDGDGDMDVLSASGGDDKIAWYENDGGSPPVFTSHVITTTADLAYEVYAADVDDDGDMDILSASHFDATIAWYENDGTSPPAFTGHVITDTASGATSVYATDVDGDGDMDVLSASRGDDRVIWWENSGPASPPSGPANSPWPMYQHDAQRTSRSPFIGPDWPYLEWSYPFATTEGGGSLPSIAPDGTIYFGKSNHLYALNPDGTLKWTYGPTPNVIWSSPAVANDGTIYVGHNGYTNGNLLAINPDGSLKWKYPAREVRSSPAIAADGTIYVGASDARLYAINPDGSLKWRYRPGFAEAYSSPAIGADGTIYIAGTKERNLHAVNPDGTTKWTYPIGTTGDTESSPTVDSNGTIYVGGSDNKLYAINPDGTPKWSYTVGDVHSIQSAAIGPDGTVYIISAAGILYAFTPAGDLKWTYTSDAGMVRTTPTVDANGTIYFGGEFNGKIYAINPDGSEKWTFQTPASGVGISTIDSNGTLYVHGKEEFYAVGEVPNIPPTADAGGPYSTNEGDTVILDASGSSDPDENIVLHEWDLDNDGEHDDATGVTTEIAFDDNGVFTVGLRVTDECNQSDTDTAEVTVLNVPPTVDTPVVVPEPSDEGGAVTASATFSDPGVNDAPFTCSVNYGDGSGDLPGTVSGNTCTGPVYTYADNGFYSVTVSVTDKDGGTGSNTATHVVSNVAPTVDTPVVVPEPSDEGSTVTASATFSDPGVNDAPFTCSVNYGDGSGDLTGTASDNTCTGPAYTYADNGSYLVTVSVTDKDGDTGTNTTAHVVNNVAPTVEEITAPVDPVQVNTEISTSADFTDPGVLDTHTAVWDWGDGSTLPGTINEADGSGSVSGSHTYDTPGVYTVKLTVTDKDGGWGESVFRYVVVYDPEGGFVTGGGWINSPEGAYAPDPSLTGKANFGFVSKYKNGANVPTGVTEFQFKVADLNFHSDAYQWLVVAGPKAQFKGTGTINGAGNYGFMLTAVDAALTPSTEVDRFRIKIWDKDDGDAIVYDNQMGADDDADPATDIGGGSIVIHKAK